MKHDFILHAMVLGCAVLFGSLPGCQERSEPLETIQPTYAFQNPRQRYRYLYNIWTYQHAELQSLFKQRESGGPAGAGYRANNTKAVKNHFERVCHQLSELKSCTHPDHADALEGFLQRYREMEKAAGNGGSKRAIYRKMRELSLDIKAQCHPKVAKLLAPEEGTAAQEEDLVDFGGP